MLTKEKTERMLLEPTFADAARLLMDCGYEDMSTMDAGEINAALERHLAMEVSEIYELTPDKSVVQLFCLKYDYHNAKVLIKESGLTETAKRLLSPCARTETEELVNIYETEDSFDAPKAFVEAVTTAKETLARTGNPQLADFFLDKAYFAELTALAKASGSDFIIDYSRMLADSANLRSASRALLMDRSDLLEKAIIPGGKVDENIFIHAVQSMEDVAALYVNSIFEKATQAGSMTSFEREVDNAVNGFLARTAMLGAGPAPVLAYLSYVEMEIMAIRIILTGKLMSIDASSLRERLRECYV